MDQTNPYQPPDELSEALTDDVKNQCPVCQHRISRRRLLWPYARCQHCRTRLRLRSTGPADMLFIVLIIISIVLMMMYDAAFGSQAWGVPLYVLIMFLVACSITYVFGRPAMVTWYGFATAKRLEKARLKHQESQL
ncbi:hypothetical protein SV7mr_41900 [Stieleria bergensis]|uniref:DUF983 domain-containing protein n=1 Tax=Stieleria bergensis TaxID=2528025 RepID=A0A517T032_9BACT|nr:hypothetical protein SV7mr_41900 [Planctomycetes bacterium SV_7m_r]